MHANFSQGNALGPISKLMSKLKQVATLYHIVLEPIVLLLIYRSEKAATSDGLTNANCYVYLSRYVIIKLSFFRAVKIGAVLIHARF